MLASTKRAPRPFNSIRSLFLEKIKDLVDRIVADGVLTEEEHREFIDSINADGEIDEDEGLQMARLFQLISEGKVKVVGLKNS